MLAMIPSPSTTRTMIAPKLKISNDATKALAMLPCSERSAICRPSHRLPVAGFFERARGAVDRRFREMTPDQHQSDGKTVDHAAWQRHCRVMGDVERRRVADH